MRLHLLAHQTFDLSPQAGIALALHVAGREDPLEPGRSHALHWIFLIVKAVVPEYLRLRIVGGSDLSAAVNQSMRLMR